MAENVLEKLFEHNNWANLQIIQACSTLSDEQLDAEAQTAAYGSIRQTLLHLVSSQRGYLALLTLPMDQRPSTPVDFADVKETVKTSGDGLLALARERSGKAMAKQLQTKDGYEVEPWVVMLQAINHADEHREQIKSMLSSQGVTPPDLDGWTYGEAKNALIPVSEKALDRIEIKLFPDRNHDDLSTPAFRQLIGICGFLLPIVLWIFSGLRPIVLHPWNPLSSVSGYYYSGSVSAFAGILFAMALFLFTYQGYDNQNHKWDRLTGIIAGGAALLVALFPTNAPSGLTDPPWWKQGTGTVHFAAASVLFTCFIVFSVLLFPMTGANKGETIPRDKLIRNVIYYVCGAGMALCMAYAVYAVSQQQPIFWPEAIALEFFAFSWLVKGGADITVVNAGKMTAHYARHPRMLANKVRRAVRSQPAA